MAEQDAQEDFSKLTLDAKLSHKVWKARVMGYEEATKLFRRIDDEKSPEYSKYTGLVKKFVIDSNQIAQEKAVEATLAFVECAAAASKICSDIVAGVVTKCLNARPKTKEASIQVCLMCVEIEQYAVVQEEIMKGFTHKQPKIVAGSATVITRILKEFGAKVMNLKTLMKALPSLFEHSDKNVRAEAKALAVELYRWAGAGIRPTLEKNLKPVQMKELDAEWEKLEGGAVPTRFIRSEQAAAETAAASGGGGGGDGDAGEDGDEGGVVSAAPAAIDPYDLADPVDMLGKMPKNFYDQLADPKWKERKEALEAALPLAQSTKLMPGEYGELMKALKKVITKDSNVICVALAGNIVAGLAKGLRKGFQNYSSFILAGIFEKFKEKKLNVVNALREAADAAYLTTTLGGFQEEATEALNNKNPNVKAEVLLFLCRCFQQCTPAMIPKPLLKAEVPLIVQKLDDTNPQVREAAMECLGTLLRVVGDRPMGAYLENVDKSKMTKIQEHREAVTLKIQTGVIQSPMKGQAASSGAGGGGAGKGGSSAPPKAAAAKAPPPSAAADEPPPAEDKPVMKKKRVVKKKPAASASSETPPTDTPAEKPKSAPPKKKPAAVAMAAVGGGGAKGKGKGGKGKKGGGGGAMMEPPDQPEPNIANEEVDEKASAVLPSGLMEQLADPKWKERLEACDKFKQFIEGLAPDQMQSLLFCKVLAKKPGWKDSNFQVMNAKFEIVATLAGKAAIFGKKSTACVLPALVEKLGDIKVKGKSGETLLVLSERLCLNYISLQVMKHSFEQKSPKVHSESLEWLGNAIKEFGFLIEMKPHVDYVKKAFGATNPAVRTSAINLLGVIFLYIGAQLRMFFEDEKPALLKQIDEAFEKVTGQSPPAPTRGPSVATQEEEEEAEGESGEAGGGGGAVGGASQAPVSLADMMPKVDISGQIKSSMISELGDKNWKVRGEALQQVQEIIKAAKFIEPSLGELPGALKARLSDSNKNHIMTTLGIIGTLASSMGSGCSKFAKTFIPGTINNFSDSKPQVRAAAVSCLNAWHTEIGLAYMVEQEFISSALATENPNLRAELLGWLEEKLPASGKLPSPEVTGIIAPLYSALEDRSGDVRKKAQVVLPLFMAHVSYDTMLKQTGKLKPASKQVVVALLEKHKASAAPPKASKAKQQQQPPPAAQQPQQVAAAETSAPAATSKPAAEKKAAKPKAEKAGAKAEKEKKTTGSASKGKGGKDKKGGSAEASGAPLVFVPNGKESRMKDEEKMKTLKWNFASPRAEFIEQLKEQMQPCASTALFTQLFHDDFKQHIAALGILTKGVSGDAPLKEAAIGCMDLLLRWVTLRFFETNTTVNLKCLEFLQAAFKMLTRDGNYRMTDYEANAFLPYLVTKVGDAKEPVRKGVRALFRELCSFYPPGKLFTFVLDGLKSKNARQRTECLEELGILVRDNGMVICGPQPQKTVPLIASQISDRDNAVRSAALNAMVVVYGNVGDAVFKFTSKLSAKDVSLFEERIRRSGTKPPSASGGEPPKAVTPVEPSISPVPTETTAKPSGKQTAKSGQKAAKQAPPRSTTPTESKGSGTSSPVPTAEQAEAPPPKPAPVTGPFSIDLSKYQLPPQPRLKAPISVPRLSEVIGPDVPMPVLQSRKVKAPPSIGVNPTQLASTSAAVSYIISQINSSDADTCCKAITQIEAVIVNPCQREAMDTHVDQLLRAVLMQMRMNFSTPLTDASTSETLKNVMRIGKRLTSCLVVLFSETSLAEKATQDSLVEVERDILTYLEDERLLKLEEAPQLIRSLNFLMLRVCDNSEKTAIFGSLLQVLLKSISADGTPSKLTEMTMKCLWKITRQIPKLLPSINMDQLLKEIDTFFQGYAELVPSPSAQDLPYRTVKTILYHVTNTMGAEVLEHMTLIKDSKKSTVAQYIRKTLAKKRLSVEKAASSAGGGESAKSGGDAADQKKEESEKFVSLLSKASTTFPPGSNTILAEIFKKIGQPAESKQGLRELYEFKQAHPEADFTVFMMGISKFYQNYIERGLKWAEAEASAATQGENEVSLVSDELQELRQMRDATKLHVSQVLNIKPGEKIPKPSASGAKTSVLKSVGEYASSIDIPASDENQPMRSSVVSGLVRPSTGGVLGTSSSGSRGGVSASGGGGGSSVDLKELRRRLDMLKRSN